MMIGHRTESVYHRYDIVSDAGLQMGRDRLEDHSRLPPSVGGRRERIDFRRVSEGIRTPDPWGHNPFGITIPLGNSMIYRGVFLSLLGWRGVVLGQLQPVAGTVVGTVGAQRQDLKMAVVRVSEARDEHSVRLSHPVAFDALSLPFPCQSRPCCILSR
jgi:hypothetical protein